MDLEGYCPGVVVAPPIRRGGDCLIGFADGPGPFSFVGRAGECGGRGTESQRQDKLCVAQLPSGGESFCVRDKVFGQAMAATVAGEAGSKSFSHVTKFEAAGLRCRCDHVVRMFDGLCQGSEDGNRHSGRTDTDHL